MDRLTERTHGSIADELVEEMGNPIDCVFVKNEHDTCAGICDRNESCDDCPLNKIIRKLAEYEDAEEQGLMKILPVAIGSDVYYIPSKVNYDLNVLHKHEENNRVYHQQVENIVFNKRGWYLECNLDLAYGTEHILVDKLYKKTWFTSKEEAEQALEAMKGGAE